MQNKLIFVNNLPQRMGIWIANLILSIILIISANVTSFSILNKPFALVTWGCVAFGAVFGVLMGLWRRKCVKTGSIINNKRLLLSFCFDIAILSQIVAGTTQALASLQLTPTYPYHTYLRLDNTPGLGPIYLILASLLALIVTWLAINWNDLGRGWACLLGAGLYSSTLFMHSFGKLEVGHVYGTVFGLALLVVSVLMQDQLHLKKTLNRSGLSPFSLWSLLFLGCLALSIIYSPTYSQSMSYWLRMATLISLTLVLTIYICDQIHCRLVAWAIVIIAGLFPIIFAVLKLISLMMKFGLFDAILYRWNPNEFGSWNVVARSVLCVTPLTFSLLFDLRKRAFMSHTKLNVLRFILGIGLFGSIFVLFYGRSWEGFFSWLIALGAYIIMIQKERIRGLWISWPSKIRWIITGGLFIVCLGGIAGALILASTVNIYSFNGRLLHWQGAIRVWEAYPWLGNGLGNNSIYTPYANQVVIPVETQMTRDNPLLMLSTNVRALITHSHNIVLEFGAGSGIIGVCGFVGLVYIISYKGLHALTTSRGFLRSGIAACLAGIWGELVWGMLDVLWVTPPFFSFPIWGLIGLLGMFILLAKKQKAEDFVLNEHPGMLFGPRLKHHPRIIATCMNASHYIYRVGTYQLLLIVVAVLISLIPSFASYFYAAGYVAFQEQRWSEAASNFLTSLYVFQMDDHTYEMLAKSELEMGNYQQVKIALERADHLKQNYSPYLNQMGWVAWQTGNVDEAVNYFKKAIQEDPNEAWQTGLHADLGLAYAHQGRYDDAILMFKESIELNPKNVTASYWRKIQHLDGSLDVVLDPVYIQGTFQELDLRILQHLGVSNITSRQLGYYDLTNNPISLLTVLDSIRADYESASRYDHPRASILLAVLAEASKLVGLNQFAESAYLEFQRNYPSSAYGFRDLGTYYYSLQRFKEAQVMFEKALSVSPDDYGSRYSLALVYFSQGDWDKTQVEINNIKAISKMTIFNSQMFSPDLYALQARLYDALGEIDHATDTWLKLAYIRGTPSDFLQIAGEYQQKKENIKRMEYCRNATESLFRAWTPSLSSELWSIGLCWEKSINGQSSLPDFSKLKPRQPFLYQIIIGHIYFVQGKFESALIAYNNAASMRPDISGPHYFLGETYKMLGQYTLAESEYLQAFSIDPLESLPLAALAQMQWDQGNRPEALESYRAVVAATPGWGPAHLKLGNALLAMGNRTEASVHYQLARIVDRDFREGEIFDFVSKFAESNIQAPGENYIRADYLTINDEQRRGLFMHPDSRAVYTVDLRTFKSPKGLNLNFDLAMLQDSWVLEGDGVTFNIYVTESQKEDLLFSEYIDPKHNYEDQKWNTRFIDLSQYAGKEISITFQTTCGPAKDCRYDWAGWGNPYIETVQLP